MAYSTPKDVFDWLNSYTKIRREEVPCDGIQLVYNLSNGNLISGSLAIKYSGTGGVNGYLIGTTLTSSSYTPNYDDGIISFTTAGLATVSGSYVWADYNFASIPDSQMVSLISASDREVERVTGRNWNSNSGQVDYFSVGENETEFFTSKYPILSISSVKVNQNDVTDTASWLTLTAGIGADYLANAEDKAIGRIRIIDNKPDEGTDNVEITYNWGYTASPQEVKTLSILYTVKSLMVNPVYMRQLMEGRDNFIQLRPDIIDAVINDKISSLKKYSFRMI